MPTLTAIPAGVTPKKWLPTLYKKTSKGADQMWSIGTYENIIVTQFGQMGGKIQSSYDLVASGKNVGRSNETTPSEQAALEAQAQWEKKKTSNGYVEDLQDARAGKRDALVLGGIDPMLAHRFDEQGHKILFPAYIQPKLDGHRCIAMIDESGKCTLWSRKRKPIVTMPHIVKAIEEIWAVPNTVLDGELYNHSYREKFEELTSFIKRDELRPGYTDVQYHIYDVSDSKLPYRDRLALLRVDTFKWADPLYIVETVTVEDEDDLMLAFEAFLVQGYEGGIVRNAGGLYVNKRSYDLQKVKEFIDEEFVVVGVEEGRGKLAGHGIFVCKTSAGVEFRAKMKGELENLKQYYERPRAVIGKLLTVKFQGYTTRNGVPRFPVALRMRENV